MADVRINALATTATTSASDDYLAIDGSANGTRKLSAYSPTFGGNLTVSGTGTFGGTNLINVSSGTPAFQISNAAGGGGLKTELNYNTSTFVTQLRALATPGSGTIFALRTVVGGTEQDTLAINYLGNATLAGNFTVNAGAVLVDGPALAGGSQVLRFNNTNTPNSNRWAFVQRSIAEGDLGLYDVNAAAFRFYLNSSGNVLVGTTIDGGQKLQVNGTAYVSGDATFAGTIKPQQAATASAPSYVKGAIYFDTTLNKLRVGGATGWETITSI